MVVGIDFGRKRIGMAALHGDGLVLPLATIVQNSQKAGLAAVVRHLVELDCERVVVGLPLNMDGTEGPASRAARQFADALRAVAGVTIELHDERLSSFEARDRLREASSRKKRDAHDDAIAACVILESWLRSHPR
jgi:putative Holliday junction resolvase